MIQSGGIQGRFRAGAAIAVLAVISVLLFRLHATAQDVAPPVRQGVIVSLDAPVTPPMARYLSREIEEASRTGKEIVIMEIDTPGGLVDSMKTIIKAIMASNTPVVTYVSPDGARAASAGLYIVYASHIAAMAPATTTGAATPVELAGTSPGVSGSARAGQDMPPVAGTRIDAEAENVAEDGPDTPPLSNDAAMRAKIINDSAAYIRALAVERGRNAEWAERAVREGISATAGEALSLGVIDIVATGIDDLVRRIDGRTVRTASGEKTLSLQGLSLERRNPALYEKILALIADPNVAVILMSLATVGIMAEMYNPGALFPGALGFICLVFGLYALQVLPFNGMALGLAGLGVVLVLVETYVSTFGIAAIAGLLCIAAGIYFLFPGSLQVSPFLAAGIVIPLAALVFLAGTALARSRRHPPVTGEAAITGKAGVVDRWEEDGGWVVVGGERWRAVSRDGLCAGDRICVDGIDGLVLTVSRK